jgi:hypothetical protein
MLAALTGNQRTTTDMRGLYFAFADCLPELDGPVPAQSS